MQSAMIIYDAIEYCEKLIEKYDNNEDITDLDICYLIEILKGRASL